MNPGRASRRELLAAVVGLSASLFAVACSGGQEESGALDAGRDSASRDGAGPDAVLDLGDANVTYETGGATCPFGSDLFARANDPQTITLDTVNAYWTNAPLIVVDGGNSTAPTGSIASSSRTGSSGTAAHLVDGLTGPTFVTHGSGYLAFSVLGPGPESGGTMGTVGLFGVSAAMASTPGTKLVEPAGVAIDTTSVYWVAQNAGGLVVESATLAGGAATSLGTVSGDYTAGGLSVASGTVYFAGSLSPGGSGGAIFTMSTSGGAAAPLMEFTTGLPYDVRTDAANVYWNDILAGAVYSMPLGGGSVTTMATGLGAPAHLAVDSTNVYVTDYAGGGLYELSIATPSPPKLLVDTTGPLGVAADDAEGLVYFTTDTAICKVIK